MILFLFALQALADEPPPVIPPETVLESHGPLSSSPKGQFDKFTVFLGGVLQKSEEDEYRRLINSGVDPATIPGPERIYSATLNKDSVDNVKAVYGDKGFHVNDPTVVQPHSSKRLYLFYTRGSNKIAEACRKKDELLRSCEPYLTSREIALATSDDDGNTWKFEKVIVGAKETGDSSGAGHPAVLVADTDTWLYYSTGKQSFVKENIYRVKISLESMSRVSDPAPIKIEGFSPGLSLENLQMVGLNCDNEKKFVASLTANPRGQNALPLYISRDGLNFRRVIDTLVPFGNKLLSYPTQLPGPASIQECTSKDFSGVLTYRDILYSEKQDSGRWSLRRSRQMYSVGQSSAPALPQN